MTAEFANKNGGPQTITVSFEGAIQDTGTATQEEVEGPDGESGTVEMQLTQGTLTGSFEEHDFELHMNEAACVAEPTSTATITITGGTGAYIGATGTLEATTKGRVVGATKAEGGCDESTQAPLSSNVTLTASGEVLIRAS